MNLFFGSRVSDFSTSIMTAVSRRLVQVKYEKCNMLSIMRRFHTPLQTHWALSRSCFSMSFSSTMKRHSNMFANDHMNLCSVPMMCMTWRLDPLHQSWRVLTRQRWGIEIDWVTWWFSMSAYIVYQLADLMRVRYTNYYGKIWKDAISKGKRPGTWAPTLLFPLICSQLRTSM
jgi:hypothetical protein